MSEEWRVIEAFPDYAVSSAGRVRRIVKAKTASPRIMKCTKKGAYMGVVLRSDGRSVGQYIHRLVALAFLGDPPSPAMQVAHNDGDRFNNAVGNLRWATPLQNCADKKRHGTDQQGMKHHMRKITEDDVREIRRLRAAGRQYKDIAPLFGLNKSYVCLVASGRRWGHIE